VHLLPRVMLRKASAHRYFGFFFTKQIFLFALTSQSFSCANFAARIMAS
jgi:hypothetical protein